MNCPTCNRNISKLGCWHCGTFVSKAEVQREYQKNYQRKYTQTHDRREYWKEYHRDYYRNNQERLRAAALKRYHETKI